MREDRCRKGCSRSLEEKRVEGDRDDVEYMWEQVKREMVESAREVRGSRIVGSKNPKNVLQNDDGNDDDGNDDDGNDDDGNTDDGNNDDGNNEMMTKTTTMMMRKLNNYDNIFFRNTDYTSNLVILK